MPELSISEIVNRYPVSDKTVRNWIHAGWLQSRKLMISGHETYVVEQSEIERILRERGIFQDVPVSSTTIPTGENNQRITDLEQRVSDLEGHIYALREAIASLRYTDGPPTPPPKKNAVASSGREKRPVRKPTTREEIFSGEEDEISQAAKRFFQQ